MLLLNLMLPDHLTDSGFDECVNMSLILNLCAFSNSTFSPILTCRSSRVVIGSSPSSWRRLRTAWGSRLHICSVSLVAWLCQVSEERDGRLILNLVAFATPLHFMLITWHHIILADCANEWVIAFIAWLWSESAHDMLLCIYWLKAVLSVWVRWAMVSLLWRWLSLFDCHNFPCIALS